MIFAAIEDLRAGPRQDGVGSKCFSGFVECLQRLSICTAVFIEHDTPGHMAAQRQLPLAPDLRLSSHSRVVLCTHKPINIARLVLFDPGMVHEQAEIARRRGHVGKKNLPLLRFQCAEFIKCGSEICYLIDTERLCDEEHSCRRGWSLIVGWFVHDS